MYVGKSYLEGDIRRKRTRLGLVTSLSARQESPKTGNAARPFRRLCSLMTMFLIATSTFAVIVLDKAPIASAEIFGLNVRVDDTGVADLDQYTPSIAISMNGTIYIAWVDERENQWYEDIYMSASTDAGGSFGKNVRINDDTGLARQYIVDIAVDSSGKLHSVWTDWRNDADGVQVFPGGGIDGVNNPDIFYSNSTDGGRTWSRNMAISNSSTNDYDTQARVAIDSKDVVHIVWGAGVNDTGQAHIFYSRSFDRGQTFSDPRVIDDSPGTAIGGLSIAIDEEDTIYVVWVDNRNSTTRKDIWFAKSVDGGSTFEGYKRISNDKDPVDEAWPSLFARRSLVGIVWVETWPMGNVTYVSSSDGGLSFSDPTVVNDDPDPTVREATSIWIDESEYMCVTWTTKRNGNYDVYFANSTDRGASFSVNQKVSDDVGTTHQSASDLAMDANGYVYLTWSDLRNGNSDIYFTRAPPDIADLEPLIINFTPLSPVEEGSPIELNTTIANTGDRSASFVKVQFFLENPSLGIQIGSNLTIPLIKAGEMSYAETSWLATPIGLHEIFVVVDPENHVTESNESNNIASTIIEVVPPPPEVLPPEDLRTSAVGIDILLEWKPPNDITNVSHYLIYRAQDQREFDFSAPIYNTSGNINPKRTNWTDANAASPGSPTEYYYTVRTVSPDERMSITSNTAGKWTKSFDVDLDTFSLPLEPFENKNVSWYVVNMPNTESIRWMDTSGQWITHDSSQIPGMNDIQANVGEGYEISLASPTTFTFCGFPSSMIRFQEGLGDSVTFRRSLTANVVGNDVNLTWQAVPVADSYLIFRSETRNGLHDLSLMPVANVTETYWTDAGILGATDEYYYTVIPAGLMGPFARLGSSTYSVGVVSSVYSSGSDTFALPLKPIEDHSLDWYCNHIPNVAGMAYLIYGMWKFHAPQMPEGVYDLLVLQSDGYQISLEGGSTRFMFIGY